MRAGRRAAVAAFAAVSLLLAACGRDEEATGDTPETTAGGADTTAAPPGTDGSTDTTAGEPQGSLLDSGGFGDIETVCSDGDASGATDVGVTDDSITVGTLTDKGFTGRPGLTREMYDTAVAFAAWCNEQGGILGRQLVISDRDAALTAYNEQITAACGQDLALVGGGAVFDDADNGGRVACGLVNFAGYVVSPTARVGELQFQPVPNPVYTYPVGNYLAIGAAFPDSTGAYGIMTAGIGSTLTVRDQQLEAATSAGFTSVYNREYSAGGESNWLPFAQEIQNAGVKVLDFVGEPTNLSLLMAAMDQAGYFPDVIMTQANFYDETFLEQASQYSDQVEVLVRTVFTPYELAAENQATQDYLDLMSRYNPEGKIALLGSQGLSAFLLFAQAANACGSELTRDCLVEQASTVTEWTGGGLHAPDSPSENLPSPCFALLRMSPDGWTLAEDVTQPTDGIFNCSDDNLLELQNDYGVPR